MEPHPALAHPARIDPYAIILNGQCKLPVILRQADVNA
jgi:hypothetical protein